MILKYLTLRILVKPARSSLKILSMKIQWRLSVLNLPQEALIQWGLGEVMVLADVVALEGGWMRDSPPLSHHTTAPPSLTPIHTPSLPVQAEVGLPDLSASTAIYSPLVGQDPLSHGGDIILEGDSFLDEIEIFRMSSPTSKQQTAVSLSRFTRKQTADPNKGRFNSIQKDAHTKEEHTCKTLKDCLTSLLKELVLLKLILNHFQAKLVLKSWLLASLLMLGQHMLDQLQA
jgi:hypothetical protein